MKIENTNNLSFGRIIISNNAQRLLYKKRLNSTKRYIQYVDLNKEQIDNPHNILISTTDNKKRLVATIKISNKKMSKPIKENFFKAIFNMNPAKYIKKLCKMANELRTQKLIKETA